MLPLQASFPSAISREHDLASVSWLQAQDSAVELTLVAQSASQIQRHRSVRFYPLVCATISSTGPKSEPQRRRTFPDALLVSQVEKKPTKSLSRVEKKPTKSVESVDRQHKVANHGVLPHVSPAPPPSDLNLYELFSANSNSSFTAAACNIADTLINSFLSPLVLKPSIDPKVQLNGNLAPVPGSPPQRCTEVRGVLPLDLNGIYIRNGPNAARINEREGFHIFDGDGMVHAVRFKAGTATFCSRFVRTNRFVQEEAAGRALFPKFFGGFYGVAAVARTALLFARAALGLINMSEGWGLSNTSVGYFNGKVLSLSEDDMPYVLKVTEEGDLVTVGQYRFAQSLKRNMCAHPKFDSATGEMFAFSFSPVNFPPFSFFRVSADGVKSPDVAVPLLDMPLVHDFAITKKYVIFPDNQFIIRPLEFLKGEMPLVYDRNKTPRFCILPRYGSPEDVDQARWFKVPGANSFHYINAWDEGDEVVIISPIMSSAENFLEIPAINTHLTLSEVRLDTKTGRSSKRKICSGNFEFGTFNQSYTGQKTRYVYMASGYYPELSAVVKVDLQATGDPTEDICIVGTREFGKNCYGNEPFFVPRSRDKNASEDDGYVLCFVHDEASGVSELLVMDAQSPSLEVVAAVKLPARVPYGFHGWFVNEEQLAKQSEAV